MDGGVAVVVVEVDHGVVLEIGTDAREIDEGGDIKRGEDGRVADARELKEGGGVDCACREDDGARSEDCLRWRVWVTCKLDTSGFQGRARLSLLQSCRTSPVAVGRLGIIDAEQNPSDLRIHC